MKVNVVGIRHVAFTDKRTGKPVEYDELHVEMQNKQVIGLKVMTVNVSPAKTKGIIEEVPTECNFEYEPAPDGKAKITGITKV